MLNFKTLHVVAIILKRLFQAKMLFPNTKPCPLCDAIFTLDLGRNGGEGKIPRLGNIFIICLFSVHMSLSMFISMGDF